MLLFPAPAGAVQILEQVFDPNGEPIVTAYDGGRNDFRWSICRPEEECVDGGTEIALRPGPQPPGTRFKVTTPGGEATSDAWGGPPALVAPPTLDTAPQVGAAFHATPGRWTGGWGQDYDLLSIVACRFEPTRECKTLYSPVDYIESPYTSIPARYVGWYITAGDRRLAKHLLNEERAFNTPEQIALETPSQTVAFSALAGPITNPYTVPRLSLPRRTRRYLGVLSCPARCKLRLVVTRGARRWVVRSSVKGKRRLSLPRGARRPGHVRVAVYADRVLLASRWVKVIR